MDSEFEWLEFEPRLYSVLNFCFRPTRRVLWLWPVVAVTTTTWLPTTWAGGKNSRKEESGTLGWDSQSLLSLCQIKYFYENQLCPIFRNNTWFWLVVFITINFAMLKLHLQVKKIIWHYCLGVAIMDDLWDWPFFITFRGLGLDWMGPPFFSRLAQDFLR